MRLHVPALAVAAALAAAVPGCGDPARAPVRVAWTFAGQTCLEAGVATIQVDIEHILLTPNRFDCRTASGDINVAAEVGSYLLGPYKVTVTGYDADFTVLYQTTQDFTVQRGDNVINVDAKPPPAGSMTLLWTFAGRSCAQAGVSAVHIGLDGVVVTDGQGNADIPCNSGQDSTQISPLAPGRHVVDLVGLRNGQPAYARDGIQVNVTANQDTQVRVDLPAAQPTSATAELSWDGLQAGEGFAPGVFGGLTCSEAQVDTVRIFLDPAPDGSGGTDVGDVPCTSNNVAGAEVTPLTAGNHSFAIVGIRSPGQLVYQTNRPSSARFELGLFTNVSVEAEAAGSALGGADLQWDFGSVGLDCQGATSFPVSYTLTDPAGSVQLPQSSMCGPRAVPVPLRNVSAGLWKVDATATVQGTTYHAQVLFGVPNQAVGSWSILFSK